MSRNLEFQIDEWYHCYTRGVEKRETFKSASDYERFLSLIYLANNDEKITLFNQERHGLSDALKIERKSSIITVGAYCLMSNHYHLILREDTKGGISKFMHKVGTGYTMYFNAKNKRVGNLFVKPFRAKHLADDNYFQRVIHYVHLNPSELFEPGWKEGKIQNFVSLEKHLRSYPYSSLNNYLDKFCPTRKIIDEEVFDIYTQVNLPEILSEAREYYEEISF